jgi:hypothetical protein
MTLVLLLQYFRWHFISAPVAIVEGWKNILWFNLNYFSVVLLAYTLFAPWKGITWKRKRAFTVGDYMFTFASNLISRIIGAVVRIPLIIVGLLGEAFLGILGLAFLAFWLLLPALIPIALIYGITLFF